MAEDDIYGSKALYEKLMANLEELTKPPQKSQYKQRYYIKNKANISYFKALNKVFERKDTSYIRRLRLLRDLLIICYTTGKDLKLLERGDIDSTIAFSHQVNQSTISKADFIKNIKYIWRNLFPEVDDKGRIDEAITPYVVRHLSPNIEKSKQKLRDDRISWEEFEKLMDYFSDNPQMQFYLALSVESLGRPQEICYTRIKDVEINENYARIWISSHGKEGTKFLQCIDSYPYLVKWLEKHPYKNDPTSFLFLSNGKSKQLTPVNINKKLIRACKKLGIAKSVTPYSLKRNGVTFSRLRGDSDVEIQHRAGWTSTKQLKIYDLSTNEDSFKRQLAKRGLIQDTEYKDLFPQTKICICGASVGFADSICPKCKRLLNKDSIKKQIEAEDIISSIVKRITEKNKELVLEAINELGLRDKIEKL